jgi:cation diffusion facilitator CzcD-associated flavoprotein CzcO
VLATGFDTDAFPRTAEGVRPRRPELSDAWRDGARAHLGMTVPGFPNLFLVHGPNTALRAGSVVHMLECQADYLAQAARRIAAGTRHAGGAPRRLAEAFDAEMQHRLGAASGAS